MIGNLVKNYSHYDTIAYLFQVYFPVPALTMTFPIFLSDKGLLLTRVAKSKRRKKEIGHKRHSLQRRPNCTKQIPKRTF